MPADAESTPELPFHPQELPEWSVTWGKKVGGWGMGYAVLYTNPTIVDAAINYPHVPLQRRELCRGDGEEC